MAHDEDMLNITQSDGDGDGEALAAMDAASSVNQSRISIATDVSPPVLLLMPRAPIASNGSHTPVPITADASLTTLDSQPTEQQLLTPTNRPTRGHPIQPQVKEP